MTDDVLEAEEMRPRMPRSPGWRLGREACGGFLPPCADTDPAGTGSAPAECRAQ
jgi:hypothetical protein